MHPEFAPVAIISAISLLLPLPWHWRAGNVATLSIIFWLFICNIIYAVDAIVWRDNVLAVAPVWCDITTKLIIGASFSLPAACLCVCIHLEQVASIRHARTSIEDKRRRQIFEGFMCFALPFIFMLLHFIVQGHRFDIIEQFGCRPTSYFSIPGIFIVWLPPILISIAALVYAALSLRHFMMRRISFSSHLTSSNSALTTSRYLRLMLMAVTQMFWSLGLTCYSLWFTVMAIPIRPWTTWDDVHSDFSRIDMYPAAFTPPLVSRAFTMLWWIIPSSTWLFVAFFAFGRDAVEEYKKCFRWIWIHVFRQNTRSQSNSKFNNLPQKTFNPKSTPSSQWRSSDAKTSMSTSATLQTSPSIHNFKSLPDDSESADFHYDVRHGFPTSDRNLRNIVRPIMIQPLPLSPPLPLTPPPPAQHRPRPGALRSPTSPRPVTYPSYSFPVNALS